MASDGIDPVTFQTGASGLAPATITYGSLNLQPLMTAMQQRARNAQNARENELALQQLAMKEKLAQDEMQLKRDQFNAEGPLREAQIANYHSLADYHNRMGKAQADAITKEWQYNRSLAPELAKFSTDVNSIDAQPGSDDWWNKYSAIQNNYAEVLATPVGQRVQGMYDTRGTRASTAIAQAQQRTADSLNNSVSKYGIPMSAVSLLQQSVDEPTQFQASAGGLTNDVWGKTQDGSRYAYFPKSPTGAIDPHADPVSLSEVNAADPEDQAKYRKVTIAAPQVESILAASRALSGPMSGSGVAPRWAYSLRGGQPPGSGTSGKTQRWVRDPTTGQLVPAQP